MGLAVWQFHHQELKHIFSASLTKTSTGFSNESAIFTAEVSQSTNLCGCFSTRMHFGSTDAFWQICSSWFCFDFYSWAMLFLKIPRLGIPQKITLVVLPSDGENPCMPQWAICISWKWGQKTMGFFLAFMCLLVYLVSLYQRCFISTHPFFFGGLSTKGEKRWDVTSKRKIAVQTD